MAVNVEDILYILDKVRTKKVGNVLGVKRYKLICDCLNMDLIITDEEAILLRDGLKVAAYGVEYLDEIKQKINERKMDVPSQPQASTIEDIKSKLGEGEHNG